MHVLNTKPGLVRTYKMEFISPLANEIDVPSNEADALLHSSQPADQPVVIPLGDINKDGNSDSVVMMQDSLGTIADSVPKNGVGPAGVIAQTKVRVRFGSPNITNPIIDDSNSVSLLLPAPVLRPSLFNSQTVFGTPGDYNGDGFTDIAVAVSYQSAPPANTVFPQEGVYIIFGRANWAGPIDVVRDADVVFRPPVANSHITVSNAGNVNGDAFDDLLIGSYAFNGTDPGTVQLYYGRQTWQTTQVVKSVDFTDNNNPNFTSLEGFFLDNNTDQSIWQLTGARQNDPGHSPKFSLAFNHDFNDGRGPTYNNELFNPRAVGYANSSTINLTNAVSAKLSFNYFLSTEQRLGADIAQVGISTGAPNDFAVIGSNQADQALVNTNGAWKNVSFSLDQVRGKQASITFNFDAVDVANNDFEGWYIDDFQVSIRAAVTPDATFTGASAQQRLGASVAGLGDVDGDGKSDFALGTAPGTGQPGPTYIISSTNAPFAGGVGAAKYTLGSPAGFLNPSVRSAGRINGPGAPDLIISNATQSYVVFGESLVSDKLDNLVTNNKAVLIPVGDLRGIGDFNKDGIADLAASVFMQTPKLDESGFLKHQAVQVYFGSAISANIPNADLLLEPQHPVFSDAASSVAIKPFSFGGLGIDGFAKPTPLPGITPSSLAVAELLGGQLDVYFPTTLQGPTPPGGINPGSPPLLVEPFQFNLAAPFTAPSVTQSRSGADLSDHNPQLSDAFAMEGANANEQISRVVPMGDLNGDGDPDFLVAGVTGAYILYGPVRLTNVTSVQDEAEIVISSQLGRPADRMADINGDGLIDLAFISQQGPNAVVSIIFGKANLPRQLGLANVDRTITLNSFTAADASLNTLRFDADGLADVLIVGASTFGGVTGYIYSGQTITASGPLVPGGNYLIKLTPDGTSRQNTLASVLSASIDPTLLASPVATYTAVVPGDVNGDGLDDILIGDSTYLTFAGVLASAAPFGRAYLILGRPVAAQQGVDLGTQSQTIWQDFALAGGVSAIGDLNHDGYDDVAISRTREDSQSLAGALFVMFGSPAIGAINTPANLLRLANVAALTISRPEASGLSGGVTVNGALQAAGGDFNGDGKIDLLIGQPSRIITDGSGAILDSNTTGSAYVFFSAATHGPKLTLSQADAIITGENAGDNLGTPASQPRVDLNGDHFDDLILGAASAEAVTNGVKLSAGRVYAIYGHGTDVPPPAGNIIELSNDPVSGVGDFLINLGTGRPEQFTDLDVNGDGIPDTNNFTLFPGTDRWYQFSTLGDGQSGNMIRLTPGTQDTNPTIPATDQDTLIPTGGGYTVGTTGPIQVGGENNRLGAFEFDLANLLSYRNNTAGIGQVDLVLPILPAAQGLSLPVNLVGETAVSGGKLYFVGDDGFTGPELWTTDGTSAGTSLVKDIKVGSVGSIPKNLTDVAGTLYFWVQGDVSPELWRSGGTAATTVRVAVLPSKPSNFVANSSVNTFYFVMTTTANGAEIWRFRVGVDVAPGLLNDFNGAITSSPTQLTPVGSSLYYTELRPDLGFGNGPFLHKDANFIGDDAIGNFIKNPTILGGFRNAIFLINQDPNKGTVGVLRTQSGSNSNIGSVITAQVKNPGNLVVNAAGDQAYVIADDTPSGRALFLITQTSGTPTNPNFTAVKKATLAADASQLTLLGTRLYFTGVSNTQIRFIDISNFNANLLISGFTGPIASKITPVGSALYFFSGTGAQTALWKIDNGATAATQLKVIGADPLDLSVSGNLLTFTTSAGNGLWVSNAATGATYLIHGIAQNQSVALKATFLSGEGDGQITAGDGFAPASGSSNAIIFGSSTSAHLDVTSAVRAALAAGQTRITILVNNNSGNELLNLTRPAFRGDSGPHLDVTTLGGAVLGDLTTPDGRVIAQGRSAIALNSVPAGTYLLHVYNPNPAAQTTPLPLTIEITPPFAGTANQSDHLPDRDSIFGGDGDDAIIGNDDLDRLFGESGNDTFIGETLEIRDLVAGELAANPLANELSNIKAYEPNPVIGIIDPVLRSAISASLGMPVTLGYNGTAITHQSILASDLAGLTQLNLAGLNVTNLSGLEYAVNLRSLDLSNTSVTDLSTLIPRRLGSGELVGLGALQSLSLDFTPIKDLSVVTQLTSLHDLSLDGTTIRNFQPLAALTDLKFLSIDSTVQSGFLGEIFTTGLPMTDFPNFDALPPVISRIDTGIDFNAGSGFFPGTPFSDEFAARWTGQILANISGNYTFYLASDDGSRLFIDNQLVIDNGGLHANVELNNTVKLNAGVHSIRVEFFEHTGAANVSLNYTSPDNSTKRVLTNAFRGLSDISSLSALTNLDTLSLHSNLISNISALAGLNNLKILDLSSNAITSVESLSQQHIIDDSDAAFTATGTGWLHNTRPISNAFEQDYLYRSGPGAAGDLAQWNFTNLAPGDYDVFATWSEDIHNSTAVTYTATGQSLSAAVDQTTAPSGSIVAGRPWQKIGTITITPGSTTATINLTQGNAGIVVADAIRLVSVSAPAAGPALIKLENNPLDNHSFELYLPDLQSRGQVTFNNNRAPVQTIIPPQSLVAGGPTSLTVPLGPPGNVSFDTGRALRFDGVDDFVDVTTNVNDFKIANVFTIEAWIYPTGAGSAGFGQGGIIVNKEGEYELARWADGSIQFAIANTSPGWAWINTGYVAALNKWTHVALSYYNGVIALYANGQQVFTSFAFGNIGDADPANNALRIGGRSSAPQKLRQPD